LHPADKPGNADSDGPQEVYSGDAWWRFKQTVAQKNIKVTSLGATGLIVKKPYMPGVIARESHRIFIGGLTGLELLDSYEECIRTPGSDFHGEAEHAPCPQGKSDANHQNNLPNSAGKRSEGEPDYRESVFVRRHDISVDIDTIQAFLVPILRAGIIRILNLQHRKCLAGLRKAE
jgi:hypothetical protein